MEEREFKGSLKQSGRYKEENIFSEEKLTKQNALENLNKNTFSPPKTLASLMPTQPFDLKSAQGMYTIYPKIDIQLRDDVFKQTGLWLRFPSGQTEINFVVGQGYFGGMYLAQSVLTKRFLGIKIILGEKEIQQSAEEGQMQMQLNGLKHLMPLVDSFIGQLQGENVLFHVMPLAGLGDVKALSKSLQERGSALTLRLAMAYHIGKGVIAGLQQMHDLHLYHLDLRSANIVIDGEGKVWAIDFGCMLKSDTGYFEQDCNGHIDCLSPERLVLRGGSKGRFSAAAADSWAVGIVLLQLLVGDIDDKFLENPNPLLNQLQRNHELPETWVTFLKGLLTLQEQRRLTMEQALQQLTALEPENLADAINQLPQLVRRLQTDSDEIPPTMVLKKKKKIDFRPIPTLTSDELLKLQSHYQEILKQRYLQHNTITQLFGKPLSLETSYINLTVIQSVEQEEKIASEESEKENKEKEGQPAFKDARLTSFEDLFGEKRNIKVDELFNKEIKKSNTDNNTNKYRFALVQGRAGIGKTTFSRYISHQWASSKLWSKN